MTGLNVALVALVFGGLACRTSAPAPSAEHAQRDALVEQCDLVTAVVRAIVRPNREEPLGLEKACVDKYTGHDGMTYVDVDSSVTEGTAQAIAGECRRDGFVIRFGAAAVTPAPPDHVVLLRLNRTGQGAFEFDAVTEDHRWRDRQARHIYSWSPCLSTAGAASLGPNGWSVSLRRPASGN